MVVTDILEKLQEDWLRLSRGSFDNVDCGLAANVVQEAIDEITRLRETNNRSSEQAGDMVDKAAAWDACVKAREEERERCAKIAEPKGPRPCDCEYGACYCRNAGDAAAVASWDADMAVARAIRAPVSRSGESS